MEAVPLSGGRTGLPQQREIVTDTHLLCRFDNAHGRRGRLRQHIDHGYVQHTSVLIELKMPVTVGRASRACCRDRIIAMSKNPRRRSRARRVGR
jgi:hypothetical protein